MVLASKRCGALILRLIVELALLGCPQISTAAGTWSVISLPQKPGEVVAPTALATDAAGDLYVADAANGSMRIQKRDTRGNWTVIADEGDSLGQVDGPGALAADAAGSLYVADSPYDPATGTYSRIQKRDARGTWALIATNGAGLGQVSFPT